MPSNCISENLAVYEIMCKIYSCEWVLRVKFSECHFVCTSPPTCHMFQQCHLPRAHHTRIWWKVGIMKFLIMQCSLFVSSSQGGWDGQPIGHICERIKNAHRVLVGKLERDTCYNKNYEVPDYAVFVICVVKSRRMRQATHWAHMREN